MSTYAYARTAAGGQASVDAQLARIREHAAIDQEYVDVDASGANLARPGLEALLEVAQTGDVIVAYDLHVLSRRGEDLAALLRRFAGRGVELDLVRP